MSDIDTNALRRLDMTLLLVFVSMMRHRKAVAVAREMGLTQSAISHSLKRLRDAFGDPLFLRQPHGMVPTSVALSLEPVIREAVETLDRALKPPAPFEPGRAEGTVRITANDNEIMTMLPPLLAQLTEQAPGLRVAVRSLDRTAALASLTQGDIDLAMGFFWKLPPAFDAAPLFSQGYRVVARSGHPLAGQGLDLETYCACRHLVVSPSGDLAGIVDEALADRGLRREVVAALPLFMPALETAATTDLVATLPERLVGIYAHRFGLTVHEPPLPLREIVISAVIHRRNAASPLHGWLVGAFGDLFGESGHGSAALGP